MQLATWNELHAEYSYMVCTVLQATMTDRQQYALEQVKEFLPPRLQLVS